MPTRSTQVLQARDVTLSSYESQKITYYFYFPAVGSFQHYPLHVASEVHHTHTRACLCLTLLTSFPQGELVAYASPTTLSVVPELSTTDLTSWYTNYRDTHLALHSCLLTLLTFAYRSQVSARGSNEQVLRFLREEHLEYSELKAIMWRAKESKEFCAQGNSHCSRSPLLHPYQHSPLPPVAATVLHVLKHERCMFDASLFSLALYHALDTEYVVDYLGSDTYYCNRLVSQGWCVAR